MVIIAANVVVFALQLVSYYFGSDGVTKALWYAPLYSLPNGVYPFPAELSGGLSDGAMFRSDFEPWRILTVMFTHSVTFLPHILFNMFALFLFGRNLEQIIGRWRFLVLYLLAGVGGSLGVMLWSYAEPASAFTPTVGASGAIFGVLAATLVAFKAMRANITSLAVLIGINFAIGFMPGASVSWQAHLGGMIVGALAMWIIVSTRQLRQKKQQIVLLAALGAVLIAVSFAFFVVQPV